MSEQARFRKRAGALRIALTADTDRQFRGFWQFGNFDNPQAPAPRWYNLPRVQGGSPMKFAFLTVSYSGQFYTGPALTLVEQIRKARQLGFDGISIEAKRPVASPLDLTAQDRKDIRAAAAAEGIAIC